MFEKSHIRLNVKVPTWKEAIREGGELLLKSGCIETEYIEYMINAVETLGPYIVIAKGIALAHSKPGIGVNRTALSLLTFSTPVSFGHTENDPVKILITLATTNNTAHLTMLKKIADTLSNYEVITKIMESSNINEVISYFN